MGNQSANKIERCEECVDLLGEYLDGSLPPARAAALEQHLSLCMPCITFVRTYKATSIVCREKLFAEMPAELVASLQQFLAAQIPGFKCPGGEAKGTCSRGEATPKKSCAQEGGSAQSGAVEHDAGPKKS